MIRLQGFWSYVHDDDEAEGGRIARLARDVRGQFEMLTGENLDLFLDRDEINWGEVWKEKIDGALGSVAFFVAVLTPRYFMSPECRRELQFFARKANQLGVRELVLPLHYVEVPELREDDPDDDLVELTRSFQWEDWTDLRFAEVSSESYRRGVARLSQRLVDANRNAEKTSFPLRAIDSDEAVVEDELPGFIDRMASAEKTLPKLVETLERLREDIEFIGDAMNEATAEVRRGDAHGAGFAARLASARKLSRKLSEPAERIGTAGNEYASQLHEVDQGFRALIERAPEAAAKDPDSKEQICQFFEMLRSLSEASHVALNSSQGMIDAIAPLEKMSRDLRPVLRRVRQGLTTMVEGREVSDEWLKLIDKSGLTCEESTAKRS